MKCHYEVLEIAPDASDSEIKTAYRKLALKWHPDKNLEDSEYAKEQFQEVQQAYEVLSDKHERAWYDSHREQILRGANSDFKDKSLDVFQYFTGTCFKGYGDDEHGFYSVYRNVFEQIAKEDIEFMDEKEEFSEIPGFGNSQSDYETVVAPFYSYWSGYSTKKSYAWLDPYDIREGRGDRRVSKLIEKENKKNRQKARKERNEEVRNLVAFVRKRDKRVQTRMKQMEEKALENRKKHEMLSRQKRMEQKKMHESETQAEWTKFHNVKSELEEIEKHLAEQFGEVLSDSESRGEGDESEEDFDNLYCIACNKMFKNPKAFENHELSKKHKTNIEKLKESIREEYEESVFSNESADGDLNNEECGLHQNFENGYVSDNEEELGMDKRSKIDSNGIVDILQEDSNSSDAPEELCQSKTKKKNRKSKNSPLVEANAVYEIVVNVDIDDSDKDFDFNETKKTKRKSKKKTGNNSMPKQVNDDAPCELPIKITSNKKKNKKEKKEISDFDIVGVNLNHCCVTCKSVFPSKNKLFEHLKKTGHGVYLPSKVKQSAIDSQKKNVKYEK